MISQRILCEAAVASAALLAAGTMHSAVASESMTGSLSKQEALQEMQRLRDECEALPESQLPADRLMCISRCTDEYGRLDFTRDPMQTIIDTRLSRCRDVHAKAVAADRVQEPQRKMTEQAGQVAQEAANSAGVPDEVREQAAHRYDACRSGSPQMLDYDCECLRDSYAATWSEERDRRLSDFYDTQYAYYRNRIDSMRANGQNAGAIAKEEQRLQAMEEQVRAGQGILIGHPSSCLSRDRIVDKASNDCNGMPLPGRFSGTRADFCGCYADRYADRLMQLPRIQTRQRMQAAQEARLACNTDLQKLMKPGD